MSLDIATLGLRIDALEVRLADRDLNRLGRTGERVEGQVDRVSAAMKRMAAMAASVAAALGVREIIEAQRRFDKLNSALITATGSAQNAAEAYKALQQFAATTPYGLAEATKAFIKLRNMGLDPSEAALRSYGNTAAAMGKSLNDMVEAVADAATGEFERLKEFGIKSRTEGDKIAFTFQGTTTRIANNAEAIEGYLQKLGQVQFAGGMELQAKTLDGAISALGDTWEATLLKISQSGGEDLARSAVDGLSGALTDLMSIIDEVSKSADNNANKMDKASIVHKALTTVFEAVAVLGVNVSYVLKQVGNEIGGIAAQAERVLHGDFEGAKRIGEMMKKDAEAARIAVDAKTKAILEASEKGRAASEAETAALKKSNEDRLAKYRIEREAAAKTAEELRKIEEAKKKAAKAYADSIKVANDFIESQRIERQEIGLNEDQLYMLEAARKAAAAPLASQREAIMANALANLTATQAERAAVAEKERYTAAVTAQLDARYQEAVAAQNAVDQAQREVDTYGMGAAAITRYTIAKLESEKATKMLAGAGEGEIAHIDRLIGKQNELLALQNRKDDLDALFDTERVQSFGDALRDAFGEAGNAMQALGSALESYMEKQDAAEKARAKAKLKYAGDDKRIAREVGKINAQEEKDRIDAYADMAGAAKGFFSEKTAGYKVLEAAERGFRTYELLMNAQAMAAKLTATSVTTAAGVAGNAAVAASAVTSATTQVAANAAVGASAAAVGVANQAKGDPYSAFARMAAMAAIMASLGFAVAGGRGSKPNMQSAEEVQKRQGTGSVFGDDSAKSDSISRSLELLEENSDLMLPLTQNMLASLRGIEAAMGGLANIVVRSSGITTGENMNIQTGKLDGNGMSYLQNTLMGTNATSGAMAGFLFGGPIGAALGAIGGKILGKLWGSVKQNITDSGLMFGGRVGDLQNGSGFNQYANVETTKKSWFGLSKKVTNSLQTGALDAEVSEQFALVFKNLEAVLSSAAKGLGMEGNSVAQAVQNFVLDTTKLSLKDLKGDELEAAINAVLSKATDDIAQAALPGFDAFRKLGEGYAETVIRVASGIEQADLALERFGIEAIKYADIGNKQGDVAAEIVRQSILAVQATGGVADIMRTLGGSASELAETYGELLAAQESLRMVGLNPGALGVEMIRGAGGLGELQSGLSDYFENFFTEAEQIAAKTESMRTKFAALGLEMPATVEAFRALVERSPQLTGQLVVLAGEFTDLMEASEASDVVSKRRELEIEIMRLQGDEAGALAAERAIELAATNESLRPLQERAWALLDEAEAADRAKEARQAEDDARMKAAEDAYAALQRAVKAEKDLKTAAFNETMKGYDAAIEASRTKIANLSSLAQTLNSARDQVGVQDTDRQGAQAQLQSMLAIARAGGVGTLDQSRLQKTLGVLAQESGDSFASMREYEVDRLQTAIAVGDLADLTDDALTTEQKSLDTLEKLKEQAKAQYEEEIRRLDAVLANAQLQLDALHGIDISVQKVEAALGSFAAAVTAIQKAGVGVSGQSPILPSSLDIFNRAGIENIYERVLGRAADASGLEFYATQLGRGATTLEGIEAAMRTSDEYMQKTSGAASLMNAPEPVAARSSTSGNSDVVAELQSVKSELKSVLVQVASYTQRTAQTNEDMERRERQDA